MEGKDNELPLWVIIAARLVKRTMRILFYMALALGAGAVFGWGLAHYPRVTGGVILTLVGLAVLFVMTLIELEEYRMERISKATGRQDEEK